MIALEKNLIFIEGGKKPFLHFTKNAFCDMALINAGMATFYYIKGAINSKKEFDDFYKNWIICMNCFIFTHTLALDAVEFFYADTYTNERVK